jgi:hypothetical protein
MTELSAEPNISPKAMPNDNAFLGLNQTILALRVHGYGCSPKALSEALKAHQIPNSRTDDYQNQIRWADARDWAIERRARRWHRLSNPAPTSMAERPMGMDVLSDQIICYLRTNYPELWEQFSKMPGPERKTLMMEITEAAINVVVFQFEGLFE